MKQLFASCLNSCPYSSVTKISSWINFLRHVVICLIFVHLLDSLNLSNITSEIQNTAALILFTNKQHFLQNIWLYRQRTLVQI
jgi:hypothetical protein